jgi:nitroimidazol reductase NimA-like FMN-containing flavoprotein (pyridoxamine 5'-phosphate oxidase superfamily)
MIIAFRILPSFTGGLSPFFLKNCPFDNQYKSVKVYLIKGAAITMEINKTMRRQDRSISLEESLRILQAGEYGILSLTCESGNPYGIPLDYALSDQYLVFHCATAGRKLDCLQNEKLVSFCVVGKTEVLPSKFATRYESVILSGKVNELQADEKKSALVLLLEKYSSDHIEQGMKYINNQFNNTKVFRINIETISGKARR